MIPKLPTMVYISFFMAAALFMGSCSRGVYQQPDNLKNLKQFLIIFVSTRDGDYSIYSMKPDGSGVKRLTDPSTDCVLSQCFDLYPTACGDTIVFSSNRTGRFQLYSMSINGSNIKQIINDFQADYELPDFSPDCTNITFTREYLLNGQLRTMNLESGYITQITDDDGSGACCGIYSPDDTTIAYIHDPQPGSSKIPGIEAPESVYTISTTGANRQWLCHTSNIIPPISWSPDGKTIAFTMQSPATGHEQIFTMPSDCSSTPTPLTDPGYDSIDPAYSPDGTIIAYASDQKVNLRIYLINTDGSNNHELTDNVYLNDQPAWITIPQIK